MNLVATMKTPAAGLALIIVLAFSTIAGGQVIPNNFDPSAREQVPDLSGIATIRFLTTADYPPFNYKDASGRLIGFNIDLANAICDNLEIVCTMQVWPWEQARDALEDFQGDALIAGLAISPENGDRFDFSQIYMMLPGRFVTGREKAEGFDVELLKGKAIGVRAGSAHLEFVRRYLPGAEAVTYEDEFMALEALKNNEVYAFFGDGLRASIWMRQNSNCCEFAGKAYFNPALFGQGLAIALPPGQDKIRRAINYAMARLKRNGTMDELYLRWFPIGFY